jgi:hypothetical protein
MKHRHLNHEEYTLAGIDDVINCGDRKDWAEMRKDALGNPVVMEKIHRIFQARPGKDPEADARRYGIWRRFIVDSIHRARTAMRKAAPLPMAAISAVAVTGPMPGIATSRWQASFS